MNSYRKTWIIVSLAFICGLNSLAVEGTKVVYPILQSSINSEPYTDKELKSDKSSTSGKVQFEEDVNGHAVLVLNCDNGENANNLNQFVKVALLVGTSNNDIISTKTGSQTWIEMDPLSEDGETATPLQLMSKILKGDNVTREGTLEIYSTSTTPTTAEFSGVIRDNYSTEDTRGKVNLIFNASNLTQTLSGVNSYTGYTKVLAGLLKMNAPASDSVILQGGLLQFLSANPVVKNLNWSSGGFAIDLQNHSPIQLTGTMNVSTLPQATDTFHFTNISAGEFTIFTYSTNLSSAFSSFTNQSVDYTWADKTYTGTFTVSSNSVKITFVEK